MNYIMNRSIPGVMAMLSATAGLMSCSQATSNDQGRPNIIYIMTDDHAFQALSAYQDRFAGIAPTPNIDRIADMGMRFDRCLVTNSICGPSRATLLTGKYSHENGMLTNIRGNMRFDNSQQTFPKLLQANGYQTAMIGKWHLGPDDPTGFDHWDILPGQGHYYNPDFINSNGTYTEHGYVTDIITDKTINWIDAASKGDKPFMVLMHHKAPHREWEPNLKYLGHFDGVVFPEPETLFDDYSGRGKAAEEQDMSIRHTMRVESDLKMWTDTTTSYQNVFTRTLGRLDEAQSKSWNAYYDPIIKDFYSQTYDDEALIRWKYQRYMEDYLGTILSVDESVGRLLDYLEETGLDKNTIVVYTSDQGFFLGEHGWFDKRFMYEESYRTPLLVQWPGVIKPGRVNTDIVSNLDFAQTFLEVAGVEQPTDMQGSSLVPLLRGKTPKDWRQEHYYHYYELPGAHSVKRHYGISTKQYKLMHFYYDIDEWEMYDLKADPSELRNVFDDPAYASVKADLQNRLEALRGQYGDSDELTQSFLPK